MLFNSSHYILFFPIVVFIYFSLKSVKTRRILLLAASWYFYMAWKPEYIVLLLVSTIADYFIAKGMFKLRGKKRASLLILSLLINLTILFGFKYFTFFDKNLYRLFSHFNIFYNLSEYNFLLPVGISFYTFQTISYTADVFTGKIRPEKDFVKFALFVSFFPQLVAGPIERAGHLMPKFEKKYSFDYKKVVSGLRLMFWGFFKKIVIADNMARFVNIVYTNPDNYFGLDIMLATFFFAIQIYGDFSGYTDIARGSARIMGVELQRNFSLPYFAKSISDFWHRWHISLSTWFRDYVYIPLGGNRAGIKLRFGFNIIVTFVLSGFWHGAGWNFIIWGLLHATYYIAEKLLKTYKIGFYFIRNKKLKRFINTVIVFLLVCFAWMFFRAKSGHIAATLVQNTFIFKKFWFSFDNLSILINFILIGILFLISLIERKKEVPEYLSGKPIFVRWSVYYVFIIIMIIFGNFNMREFIYFQF